MLLVYLRQPSTRLTSLNIEFNNTDIGEPYYSTVSEESKQLLQFILQDHACPVTKLGVLAAFPLWFPITRPLERLVLHARIPSAPLHGYNLDHTIYSTHVTTL
ncbi:hypothetical protein SAMD00019534_084320 [Acytostelium subglobosum LB1]|uniref:hypothetical protein n=1 Tax=Acytostelium subglobosum LB1 TaxID=1410327 RepID=UPI0006451333|nr:hypothetical protein SAMD00019534_084320 [Acytostelium subglobosum LB1]GAM25257.1 hypothetical protein SAMD00019534_084320 [Acytostelium subglobosum LB1]|eukprot:XP_012751777.1 hypothetical protein SAMD00019534_084320 [Acytostelium subglobosum LB1]